MKLIKLLCLISLVNGFMHGMNNQDRANEERDHRLSRLHASTIKRLQNVHQKIEVAYLTGDSEKIVKLNDKVQNLENQRDQLNRAIEKNRKYAEARSRKEFAYRCMHSKNGYSGQLRTKKH